ncbi:MAG: transposase, partial [Myxococcota bacterium]
MAPVAAVPPGYERRRPEETALYQVLQQHLETFLERTAEARPDRPLPAFIERELRAVLDCGVLAHGFARVYCPTCRDDMLVAFSCKSRGVCPSCGGRRMADTAAHLVDRVLPRAPVRQWVLTLPFPLRYRLGYDHELLGRVLRIFIQAVTCTYRRLARQRGLADARTGAVTAIQRAGSALNLNPHFHTLFLDGVFVRSASSAHLRFVPIPITDEDVERVLARTVRRVHRLLVDRGLIPADPDDAPADEEPGDPDAGEHPVTAACSEASVRNLDLFASAPGAPVDRKRVIGSERRPRSERPKPPLCVRSDGFDLHAATRVVGHRRDELERLCRYILRPPISYDRLDFLPDGRLELALPRTWSDGTRSFVFSPLTFIARLVPLVPRPRANLFRYHGVLAPAAAWRADVVALAEPPDGAARPRLETSGCPARRGSRYLDWATLLRRTFGLEVLICATCGGRRRILALIQSPITARQILRHLDLPAEPPRIAPARPPPDPELDL